MTPLTADYTVDLPADEAGEIARLLEQTAGHLAIRAHWHGCGRANLDEWLNGHRPDREPSFVRELLAKADRIREHQRDAWLDHLHATATAARSETSAA